MDAIRFVAGDRKCANFARTVSTPQLFPNRLLPMRRKLFRTATVAATLFIIAMMGGCTGLQYISMFNDPVHEAYFRQHRSANYSVLHYNADSSSFNLNVPYRYSILPGDVVSVRYLNAPRELLPSLGLMFRNGAMVGVGAEDPLDSDLQGLDNSASFNVDAEGNIEIGLIGKVHLAGLTIFQAADTLSIRLSRYYTDARVQIQITSLRCFLFGEVNTPGVITLTNQRTHLLEVIARSGGVTSNGRINKVRLIRKGFSNPQVFWINLRNISVLTHPELIVQDQDIIYVETRTMPYILQEVRPYTFIVNIASLIPSVIVLVTRF